MARDSPLAGGGTPPVHFYLNLSYSSLNKAEFELSNGEKAEYGHGDSTAEYYEVIDLELAKHHQTILLRMK